MAGNFEGDGYVSVALAAVLVSWVCTCLHAPCEIRTLVCQTSVKCFFKNVSFWVSPEADLKGKIQIGFSGVVENSGRS